MVGGSIIAVKVLGYKRLTDNVVLVREQGGGKEESCGLTIVWD